MDFAVRDTPEQIAFRNEVRDWLKANIPAEITDTLHPDPNEVTEEQFTWGKQFRQKLGQKGWLAPTWPQEYAGGGLSLNESVVIDEELSRFKLPYMSDLSITLAGPAIRAWGTDEQKQFFLPPMLKGDVITWQCFTEPEAGSDLASLKMRAVLDGDDYVINGTKIFIGGKHTSDWLYTLAVTDPNAPRHQNISAFMVPSESVGLSITHLDLVAGGGKRMAYYEDVRVPREYLIGGENGVGKGWWVAQTTLELEHGGSGRVVRDQLVDQFIDYCKTATRHGKPISSDPRVQDILARIYIASHVGRLIGTRNYWMRSADRKFTYEGSQFSLWGKTFQPWFAKRVREAIGPYATINDDKWAPVQQAIEDHQRQSLLSHPGGTPEIQKVIMARAMGISRSPNRTAEHGRSSN